MSIMATMFDITWFFTGLEQINLIVLRNTIIKLSSIILTILCVKKPEDLLIYFLIYSGSALVSSIATWMYLPRLLIKIKFKDLKILPHFKQTFIYFIPTIATSVYTLLDRTLIGVITGSEVENGYYAQAEKIINLVLHPVSF